MDNTFAAVIEKFDCAMGWHYASVPTELGELFEHLAGFFKMIAVTAQVGSSSWPTSLMPKGDGTLMIALPAKVRKKEGLSLGMPIEVSFEPRARER